MLSLRTDSFVPAPDPGQTTSNSFAWGVDFAVVPTPASAALLLTGGVLAARRRRG